MKHAYLKSAQIIMSLFWHLSNYVGNSLAWHEAHQSHMHVKLDPKINAQFAYKRAAYSLSSCDVL